jgi:hypothetical protein
MVYKPRSPRRCGTDFEPDCLIARTGLGADIAVKFQAGEIEVGMVTVGQETAMGTRIGRFMDMAWG